MESTFYKLTFQELSTDTKMNQVQKFLIHNNIKGVQHAKAITSTKYKSLHS